MSTLNNNKILHEHIKSNDLEKINLEMAKKVKKLSTTGLHLGHNRSYWNPKMCPFIYTEKHNTHVIDLVQTLKYLRLAGDFVKELASQKKTFLFVGTKKQASIIISNEAKRCNNFYVNHRWLGGMLTNWQTIKTRIEHLVNLEKEEAEGKFLSLKKKEVIKKMRELNNLKKYLGGMREMKKQPDAIIIIDQQKEITAVREAIKLNIPIIGLVDTNCNPELFDFPIPGNDDTINGIQYILNHLVEKILQGYDSSKLNNKNLKTLIK